LIVFNWLVILCNPFWLAKTPRILHNFSQIIYIQKGSYTDWSWCIFRIKRKVSIRSYTRHGFKWIQQFIHQISATYITVLPLFQIESAKFNCYQFHIHRYIYRIYTYTLEFLYFETLISDTTHCIPIHTPKAYIETLFAPEFDFAPLFICKTKTPFNLLYT
jgi:hypothetical protein